MINPPASIKRKKRLFLSLSAWLVIFFGSSVSFTTAAQAQDAIVNWPATTVVDENTTTDTRATTGSAGEVIVPVTITNYQESSAGTPFVINQNDNIRFEISPARTGEEHSASFDLDVPGVVTIFAPPTNNTSQANSTFTNQAERVVITANGVGPGFAWVIANASNVNIVPSGNSITLNATAGAGTGGRAPFIGYEVTTNQPVSSITYQHISLTDIGVNSSRFRMRVPLAPNLVTKKTLTSVDATPSVGDAVTFQIEVTNEGTVQAPNVSLTDVLPTGLTLTGITPSGSTTYNSGNGLWDIGTIAAGASATLTLTANVNSGQGGNSITNTTTAAIGDLPDPTTVGDDLTETIVIVNDIEAGDNDFSGTPILSTGGTTTTVFTDDTINGNSFANGDVITTIIDDDGLTGVTINNNGIITVPSGTTPGTYNIEYQICEDGNPTNCDTAIATIVVMALADLSITKTNTPGVNGEVDQANDTVIAGSTTNYTLIVTNNGPDSVTGAVVTDTPTAGITCPTTNAVTISGNGVPAGSFTFNDLANGGITLGTLADGQSATLTYSCTVN